MLVLLEERKLICGLPSQFAVPIGSPPVHLHSGSNWLVQGTLQVMWHADPFQFPSLSQAYIVLAAPLSWIGLFKAHVHPALASLGISAWWYHNGCMTHRWQLAVDQLIRALFCQNETLLWEHLYGTCAIVDFYIHLKYKPVWPKWDRGWFSSCPSCRPHTRLHHRVQET